MPNKGEAPRRGKAESHTVSSTQADEVLEFGPYLLDPAERVLTRHGAPLSLTPKAFETLLVLVRNGGRLLSKNQLMDAIWPDTFVDEKTLAQNVFILRRTLGLDEEGQQYIETVPKRGYRFRAAVEVVPREERDARAEGGGPGRAPAGNGDGASRPSAPVGGAPETFPRGAHDTDPQPSPEPAPVTADASTVAGASAVADASRGVASARRRPRWRAALLVLLAAVVVFVLLAAGRGLRGRRVKLEGVVLRQVTAARLTSSGNITALDLSRDGQYVAFAAANGGGQSLFVRHVNTPSAVEIVPPSPVEFRGLTFSRDGAWLFYVTRAKGSPLGVLYRVPALGGTATEVVRDVDSPVALAPDGDRVAFIRFVPERGETALVVARVDGGGERLLAARGADDGFSLGGPSWSPDGRVIISGTLSMTHARRHANMLVAVDTGDGSMRSMVAGRWSWIGRVSWLSDGSGVLITAWDGDSEVMSDQVWVVAYPGGEARRVTHDISGFRSLGASESAKVLAAVRSDQPSGFWVAPKGDWARARRITNWFGDPGSQWLGLAWTPDARLVYAAGQNGQQNIWSMNADGTEQRQLTFDSGAAFSPAASPDGRFIAFLSHRNGKRQLWRMDADGADRVLLTDSEGDSCPSISPDGRWVVYETYAEGKPTIWRVPLEGGRPVQLTRESSRRPAVSPDGKTVACLLRDEKKGTWKLSLVSFEDGRVVKQFPVELRPNGPELKWSPDGSHVTYVVTADEVSNVWGQPVKGGDPRQLTAWASDRIYRFDWFKDGTLACERGTVLTDVILIRDAGPE